MILSRRWFAARHHRAKLHIYHWLQSYWWLQHRTIRPMMNRQQVIRMWLRESPTYGKEYRSRKRKVSNGKAGSRA